MMRCLMTAVAALMLATSPLAARAQAPAPAQQNGVAPFGTPQPTNGQPTSGPSTTGPSTTGQGQPTSGQPAPKQNRLAKRFAAANTTHDGHLTLDQAKSAKWRQVVKNFTSIDAGGKGYVTEQDIRSAAAKTRAAKQGPASKT